MVIMVSKTRPAGIPGLKGARERCEKMKDPEERRKGLDDVLFDTTEAVGIAVQEMDSRNAERMEMMEQRLTNLIDKGFNKVDTRLNDIEKRVGLHDVDIAQIKSWVGTMFERFSAMEPRIATMGEKIDTMGKTIEQYFSKKKDAGMHQ